MAVTVLHPIRKTLGDMGSPKSLKHNDFGPAPPLRSTSLKSKKSHLMLSALHRRSQSSYFDSGGIKNKDFNAPSPIPFLAHKREETSHMRQSYGGTENIARRQKRPESIQRNATRSKTILRLFSSKLLARSSASTPSQPLLRSPTQFVSAFGSKETRDAALRERGLLPPLEPNADLSLAERERDRQLPVLTSPRDEETSLSPAARVKQEWESKCKGMTPGGLTSSPLPPISQVSAEQLSADRETPSLSSHTTITSAQSVKSKQSLVHVVGSNNLDGHGHPTEPQQISPSTEPYLIPLPPSPSPSSTFRRSLEDLAVITLVASLPLSSSSGLSASALSPAIHIIPPIIHASAPGHHSPTRSPLVSNASLPVITVPALVTSSSASPNLLDNDSTVMIQSPVEETSPLPGLSTISDCPHDPGDSEVPVHSDASAAGSTNLRKARARNFTDPTGLKRKLSFNPFKSSSADSRPNNVPPRRLSMRASVSNVRRSLVGSFLRPKASSGLAFTGKKAFDVPNLPPSPTLPDPCADQAGVSPVVNHRLSPTFLQKQRRPAPPELTTRVPVSPTLYTWRSIVAETNNIEDEESRRMTELAFLG